MFPFRYQTIFRSRWMALLWAGGILWLAYDVAGAAGPGDAGGNNQQVAATDATGAPITQQDVDALKSAMNQL
jgi:hypothetical protein